VLGCGHVFDLLMRPIHVPLAMMPSSLIVGPDQLHALKAQGRKWVFPDHRSRHVAACVSQSPALANLVKRALRLSHATTGSR
jgi:hypothetical protein